MMKSALKNFRRESLGNVSITTALVGTLLMTAVGASMDGGRMITTKMKLQSITDAAALMAATPETLNNQAREQLAFKSIQSHVERRGDLVLETQDVFVRNDGDEVEVAISAEVPLIFGAFLGGSQRKVSVSSTAEAVDSPSANAVSISVILDLSDSMDARFDRVSRISAVQSVVSDTFRNITSQFGGEVAAQTSVSTGLYPFNWGLVDERVVPVGPGTTLTTQSLNLVTLDEGSVPPEAFERAVAEQIAASGVEGQRDRYILFLTDGAVENERADMPGQYLRGNDIYDAEGSMACREAIDDLELAQRTLNDTFNYMYQPGNSATLYPHGPAHTAMFTDSEADTEAHGRIVADMIISNGCYANCRRIGRDLTVFLDAKSHRDLTCKPRQTQRVVDACEEARDNDISVIAVDMAGDDWATADLIDLCVNPDTVADRAASNRETDNPARPRPLERALSHPTQTFPSGLEVQLSVDGESMSAQVGSLKELREVLATMLPDSTQNGERTVRLVG